MDWRNAASRRKRRGVFADVESSKKKQTIAGTIINVLNNKHFKSLFEVAKELGTAITTYREKGSKWALIAGVGSAAIKLADSNEVYIWDYFDEWESLLNKDFAALVTKVVTKWPHEDIISEQNAIIRIHDVDGCKVGYIATKKYVERAQQMFVLPEHKEKAESIIRAALWKRFDGQNIVIKKNRRLLPAKDEDWIQFEIDEYFKPLHSELAEKFAAFYKRCDEAGMSRALLLYGPPGTGKSTMARSIINKLGYKSFRVKLSDLHSLDGSTLGESIQIFQPDALILDDLDRSHNQEDLLETLEIFHDKLKLVIATANNTARFDRALLRPGRFDDIELVERLDDEVIKKVLGDHGDLFEEVKMWPIVFIEDLMKRFKVMTPEDAKNSIKELGDRVTQICDYDVNDDEWSHFPGLVSSKKKKTIQDLTADEALEVFERMKEEEDEEDDEGKD